MAPFLYPRYVTIRRPNSVSPVTASPPSVRLDPYSGVTSAAETIIFADLPANIYNAGGGARQDNKLPASVQPSSWLVLLPAHVAALGEILNRDVVVDDQGQRYEVQIADWTSFGWTLHCLLLEI